MSKISILTRTALGKVCLKLVIVMGVTWIIDVISWAVGGPGYIWYVTDVINAMQGVLIFIVVGCQPQVHLKFSLSFMTSLKNSSFVYFSRSRLFTFKYNRCGLH